MISVVETHTSGNGEMTNNTAMTRYPAAAAGALERLESGGD